MAGAIPSGSDPSGFDLGDFGMVGAAMSGLESRTQENVEDFYRGVVQSSPGWQSATDILFDGLDAIGSFTASLIYSLVRRILGVIPGGTQVADLLQEVGEWFYDRWQDLADIISNFGEFIWGLVSSFDIEAAIELLLSPFTMIADLAWNLLHDPIEVLGTIPQALVSGLETTISWLTSGVNDFIDFITGLVSGFNISDAIDLLLSPFSIIADLLDDLWSNPANLIQSIPQTLVSGLNGVLSGLNSAINSATNFIQNVVDAIISAIRKVPFVGGTIANLLESLTGYVDENEEFQVEQQNFTISTSSNTVNRTPLWAMGYPLSAVSYPAILNSSFYVYSDSVGPATAGTDHSHEIRGGTDNARAIAPYWTVGPGEARGAFLIPDQDMVFVGFSFIGYAENAPISSSLVSVQLLREQPSGNLTQVINANVGEHLTTSALQLDLNWVNFRWVARRGEKYLLKIRNNATGPEDDPKLWVRGLRWQTGVPNIQWHTDNAEDSNKSTYDNSEKLDIINNSTVTTWVALRGDEDTITESLTYADNFNRPELGYHWHQLTSDTGGDLVITNNRLSYGGTTNGYEQVIYIHPLATDSWKMEAVVTGVNNSASVVFWCGSGRMGEAGMLLAINESGASLISRVNSNNTTVDSVSRTGNNGKWTITHDHDTREYNVLFNGEEIGLSWTDSGEVMPYGRQFRYFQIQINRASGQNAGQVDEWMIQDWLPE